MSKFFFIVLVSILNFFCAFSSSDDILIIKFKNSYAEKILLTDILKITFEEATVVEEKSADTTSLTAKGNYPNPFSEKTKIEFEIPRPGNVQIIIYNNNGQQVQVINCDNCSAGKNSLEWNGLDKDGKPVPANVYFYEVHFGKDIQSKKMILSK
ncbi:MAG: FlgD immunoglobulin-like domain containing protein [Candidatus Kapaibacteriota bacterium]